MPSVVPGYPADKGRSEGFRELGATALGGGSSVAGYAGRPVEYTRARPEFGRRPLV